MDLSDVTLRQISDNLGAEWEKLATFLGFSKPKIDQFKIDGNQRGIDNSMFTMLVSWRERQPVNFRRELRDVLVKCGRSDLAESILEDSPKALLDQVYASISSKLETKPELFEEAVNLFYKGYVSLETDSQLVSAMSAFGQGAKGTKPKRAHEKIKEVEKMVVKKWRRSVTIKSQDGGNDVTGIAIHPSGNIALIDRIEPDDYDLRLLKEFWVQRVYVFNQDGSPHFVLNSTLDTEEHIGRHVHGIAITTDGKYVIADGTTLVKVFNSTGQYLESFTTLSEDDGNDLRRKASARSITVNPSSGDILVGDNRRGMITVHDGRDFKIKQKLHIDLEPGCIAVNSKDQIFVTASIQKKKYKYAGKVLAFDYEGDNLFTIVPVLGGEPAKPNGVVCDSSGDIYITVVKFDAKSQHRVCHIHYYNSEGKFVKCIAKGLYWPMGIALKNDVLAVADMESAKIYKPE